jgi:hypothetical protein
MNWHGYISYLIQGIKKYLFANFIIILVGIVIAREFIFPKHGLSMAIISIPIIVIMLLIMFLIVPSLIMYLLKGKKR